MNLKELSQIDISDLKNIDLQTLRGKIQSNPQILINIVLVGLSIFIAMYFYTDHSNQLKKYKKEVNTMREKLDAAEKLEKTEASYNEFVATLPKSLNVDKLNEQISSLAFKNNIKIINFSPVGSTKSEFYTVESIEVALSAQSYESIINLIEDIENTEYTIRIESWSGQLEASQTGSVRRGFQRRTTSTQMIDTSEDQNINLNLTISTIEFTKL